MLFEISTSQHITEVTHTDAIEETDEPPKKMKIEVLEDATQPKKKERSIKVETEPEEPQKITEDEPLDQKKPEQGIHYKYTKFIQKASIGKSHPYM